MKNFSLYSIVLCSLLLSACSKKDHDTHDHPKSFKAADYYKAHCSECHLNSGMGKVLDGIPPIFYSEKTHSQLRKYITSNVVSPKYKERHMPIYTKMPKKEARKITHHIDVLFKNKLR